MIFFCISVFQRNFLLQFVGVITINWLKMPQNGMKQANNSKKNMFQITQNDKN